MSIVLGLESFVVYRERDYLPVLVRYQLFQPIAQSSPDESCLTTHSLGVRVKTSGLVVSSSIPVRFTAVLSLSFLSVIFFFLT